MDSAIQIISKDKTVWSNSVKVLKDFNSQSLPTQAKKGEKSASILPAIEKASDFIGEDIVDLSTENESLKKIGFPDENGLRILKQNF